MAATTELKQKVYQFKYYGSDSTKNEPEGNAWIGLSSDATKSSDLLAKYGAAVKIGIQTLPGIKFYISDSNLSNGIIIDHTGVYELDLRNTTTAISNLRFDAASLSRIDEVDNASLIVDVLCNSTNDEAVN